MVAVCECSEFDEVLCIDRIWSQFERSVIVSVKRKNDSSWRNSSDLIESRARWDNDVRWRYTWIMIHSSVDRDPPQLHASALVTVLTVLCYCVWMWGGGMQESWSTAEVFRCDFVWMWGGGMQGSWSTAEVFLLWQCVCKVEIRVDRDPQRLLRPTEGWRERQRDTGPSGSGPLLHMPHRCVHQASK